MTNKKLSDTTDQGLAVDYAIQMKIENNELKEKLKQRKQAKYLFDGKSLKKVFDHWTWGWITFIGLILSVILTINHIWPSTYKTGRFYLEHEMYDYKRPKECNYNQRYHCRKPPGDLGSCYTVIREVENGIDDIMTACIRDKDKAYKIANEFADEWKKLKGEEESHE